MILVMKSNHTQAMLDAVTKAIENVDCTPHVLAGIEHTIVGAIGESAFQYYEHLVRLPGVARAVRISAPFKLASREFKRDDSAFDVGGVTIGGDGLAIIAGPCSIESRTQIIEIAHAVKEAGAHMLRGGAYKPRTSPYSFQGLGLRGLEYLAEAGEATGLPVITEVMEPNLVPLVAEYADMLQIGARSMQNYPLLHAVGHANHPVLLKRGMSSTIEEWLLCAEYILCHGNQNVALCERGIRTYEKATRNTFDINAIPVVRHLSHLPIIADPSHGVGHVDYVGAVSKASIAAGANGVILEVHNEPEKAMSDGAQSLKPEAFAQLVQQLYAIQHAALQHQPAYA